MSSVRGNTIRERQRVVEWVREQKKARKYQVTTALVSQSLTPLGTVNSLRANALELSLEGQEMFICSIMSDSL